MIGLTLLLKTGALGEVVARYRGYLVARDRMGKLHAVEEARAFVVTDPKGLLKAYL